MVGRKQKGRETRLDSFLVPFIIPNGHFLRLFSSVLRITMSPTTSTAPFAPSRFRCLSLKLRRYSCSNASTSPLCTSTDVSLFFVDHGLRIHEVEIRVMCCYSDTTYCWELGQGVGCHLLHIQGDDYLA